MSVVVVMIRGRVCLQLMKLSQCKVPKSHENITVCCFLSFFPANICISLLDASESCTLVSKYHQIGHTHIDHLHVIRLFSSLKTKCVILVLLVLVSSFLFIICPVAILH